MSRRPPLVRVLLELGAEVDPKDAKGNTALAYATSYSSGSGACIPPLLEAGADPWSRNVYGTSPVELARKITSSGHGAVLHRRAGTG